MERLPACNDISVLAPHDLVVGDSITFSGVVRTSGDINLNGTFTVTEIVDLYQFKSMSVPAPPSRLPDHLLPPWPSGPAW